MMDYKKEYEIILQRYNNGLERVKELEEDDKVKEYLELREMNRILSLQLCILRDKIKRKEYAECNHIWVVLSDDGRGHEYCGCIKCGLDERVRRESNLSVLSNEEIVMKEFMRFNYYEKGYYSSFPCNLQLARAIYSKIKENYPDIDDETALKYFETAIGKIRINSKKGFTRVRRLGLNPYFNEWGI